MGRKINMKLICRGNVGWMKGKKYCAAVCSFSSSTDCTLSRSLHTYLQVYLQPFVMKSQLGIKGKRWRRHLALLSKAASAANLQG